MAVALKHDFYDSERYSIVTSVVQEDQKGVEIFLSGCSDDRVDAILKLKHGQPAQITPSINGPATGLPTDAEGHLLIEGYQWVGVEAES